MMRALHVIAGLDPRHGGPSYSVPRLALALRAAGADAEVHCVAHGAEATIERVFAHPQSFSRTPLLSALRISRELKRALRQRVGEFNIVHAHGLWLMPNVESGRCAQRAARPLMVSPRGMLAPAALAQGRLKKRLFWQLLQRAAYAGAACFHATSEAEAADIRAFGIDAPIVVIGNGVDSPPVDFAWPERRHELLALGRLHPHKGLDRLIDAWALLANKMPSWSLHLVGPEEPGYAQLLRAQIERLKVPRVVIEGSVAGMEKWQRLARASALVLASRSENFGLVVAEALMARTPVVVSKGAPWSAIEDAGCGLWSDTQPEALASALLTVMELAPAERALWGERGEALVRARYGWPQQASRMLAAYQWLCGGSEPESLYRERG
jgi:glycosyltransferase involved in cell wall biosynthesis